MRGLFFACNGHSAKTIKRQLTKKTFDGMLPRRVQHSGEPFLTRICEQQQFGPPSIEQGEAMQIDRCTCHDRTFADVLKLADYHGTTQDFEGTLKLSNCGKNCSVCHAYIRETLRTGRTCFDCYPSEAQ